MNMIRLRTVINFSPVINSGYIRLLSSLLLTKPPDVRSRLVPFFYL